MDDALTDKLLQGTVAAFQELAQISLDTTAVTIPQRHTGVDPALQGASIKLKMDAAITAHFGIFSDTAGCEHLARGYLRAPRAPLGPAEVADAVGELTNIMVGIVKREFLGVYPEASVGLPVQVRDPNATFPASHTQSIALKLDDSVVCLAVRIT